MTQRARFGRRYGTTLAAQARRARRSPALFGAAILLAVVYNAVGVLDAATTEAGISAGVASEANPLMRAVMEAMGTDWTFAKISLHVLLSAMVLWFPHRIVLAMFSAAVALNALVVANNFRIIGIF